MASSSPNKRREMDLYKLSASWVPCGWGGTCQTCEEPARMAIALTTCILNAQ